MIILGLRGGRVEEEKERKFSKKIYSKQTFQKRGRHCLSSLLRMFVQAALPCLPKAVCLPLLFSCP